MPRAGLRQPSPGGEPDSWLPHLFAESRTWRSRNAQRSRAASWRRGVSASSARSRSAGSSPIAGPFRLSDHQIVRLPGWTGVPERRWTKSPDEEVRPPKTAWDVLQLLIVPVMLVLIALYFNASQASRDRSREDRRSEDATLDSYLGKMSGLMLDRDLLTSRPGSAVREVARAETLSTVRRLSGERKGEVVRFLEEAGLLRVPLVRVGSRLAATPTNLILDLDGADLRGVDLRGFLFSGPERSTGDALGGDLRGARFDHALLEYIVFYDADLRGASFEESSFNRTDFLFPRLQEASFKGAYLNSAYFIHADLRGASFEEAVLAATNLEHARLNGAVFDDADITYRTNFTESCLDNASFVGASFNVLPGEAHDTTSFRGAEGRGVDFSHALNLSSLDVRDAAFKDARLNGADGRPKGWGPKGTLHPNGKRLRSALPACGLGRR